MLTHFIDTENNKNIIGFYSVKQDPLKVLKIISSFQGSVYEPIEHDHYDELGTFNIDTLIVSEKLMTDDMLELIEYGIMIYVVYY